LSLPLVNSLRVGFIMFKLISKFKPKGDQPKAIKKLVEGVKRGNRHQTLLGVTGSGKTFVMANVIAQINKPTLVISHNKTLAAQLCQEYRSFFPKNAVEYFISYYDYYQPEAYLAATDTYIDKEAVINKEIERLRFSATQALISRPDVIVVASVSCIYNIGPRSNYEEMVLKFRKGMIITRIDLLGQLIKMQYQRTTVSLDRGKFRLKGEILEIMPIDQEIIYRIEFKDQEIKEILEIDQLTKKIKNLEEIAIFPAKHFITPESAEKGAISEIKEELKDRMAFLKKQKKFLEVERLERKVKYDLEMIKEIGYCHGIENYSRFFDGRLSGEPPQTLIDYFPKDFLLVIDESHITIPQIRGMYEGDKARKKTLIEYGFRLPSALDNRPLTFKEFEEKINQVIYTTATPSLYEIKKSAQIVEQIIRPTGLVDPDLVITPILKRKDKKTQIEDVISRVKERLLNKERVLITTLTKKMAEDLSNYLNEHGIEAKYLHSEIKALDRIEILTDFRKGIFDVLVGVNLLREGLDLPEVSLVLILDADKEGFLRSTTSLIQTIGRASRNVEGRVVLYADEITSSLGQAIKETNRRRKIQIDYNRKHHITPKSIKKEIKDILGEERREAVAALSLERTAGQPVPEIIAQKEKEMKIAAKNLDFELAAILRDQIKVLKQRIANRTNSITNDYK